jgi:hypothetical protein
MTEHQHHGYLLADANTGRILSIRYPTGHVPTNGVTEDGLFRNIIITNNNLPNEQCLDYDYFIRNYYYHEPTGTFVYVGTPPNDYATWNFDQAVWEWPHEKVMQDIRQKRNNLLVMTDFVVLPDAPFTLEQKTEALLYRQALRDFPSTVTGNPVSRNDVTFPTPPDFL